MQQDHGKNALFKIIRHAGVMLKHLTPRKFINCGTALTELKLRRTRLMSRPYIARINTYPFCNLSCKGCMGSGRQHTNMSHHIMTTTEYKTIIDNIGNNLLFVILYDEGEPLLNPAIFDMAAYNASKNIGSVISTNFSLDLTDSRLKEMVDSGLSRLIVALDGVSQEVYGRYRVGGKVDLVKENLIRVSEIKRALNTAFPVIEVQYLDFGYNRMEIEAARQFSIKIKADHFNVIKAPFDGIMRFEGRVTDRIALGCGYLWSTLDVNNDGKVYPCDYGEDYGMEPIGSCLDMDINEIWNCRELVFLRNEFQRKSTSLSFSQCRQCPVSESLPWFLR